MRRGWALFSVFVLANCFSSGGACPSTAGGDCDPLEEESQCPGDYYCARSGICTKTCSSTEECKVTCEQCKGAMCTDAGLCGGSGSIVCEGGYCVNPDNPSDPYGPKDPSRE
jgi:hypothetical protein